MRLNMHKLKNKFKRLFMSAATIGTACLLAGCGAGAAAGTDNSSVTESQSGVNGSEQENASSDSQKLQIVATIFPEYDWVKEILGDQAENVDLTLLLGNGTDMHSFQPTMEDILKVSTCDLFIYVGGESDSWVADALKGAGNPDRKAINLMDVLGDQVKEEELVEGMQDEDDHTHEEGHTHDDDLEYDEHVWLSLKMRLYSATPLPVVWLMPIRSIPGFISRTPRLTKKNWQLSIRNTRHQWRNPSQKPCFLQIVSRSAI